MTDFHLIVPEATLLGLACLVLLVDAFRSPRSTAATFWTAILAGLVVLGQIAAFVPEAPGIGFHGSFRLDVMGAVLKAFCVVLTLFSFFYTREYCEKRKVAMSEFYPLALFATLGMMLLISANSLLTVYLGLELLSLSLYALVAMNRDSAASSEAAMKYFVLGALASGMLLYGISMVYGVTGTIDLPELLTRATAAGDKRILVIFGLVFMVVGISFKLGVVPFHMWVPDVYQGAATPVTLFIGTAPKLAAFAMAVRVLVFGLSGLAAEWQQMLIVLCVLSMGVGNIVAIAQTNFKRMLAYSTIAHMGFLLLGILSANGKGYAASMFYSTVYSLMSMGAFGSIILLANERSESDQLSDLAGLAKRSPWFAFMVLVLVFSLAGVPPFAGFWAKWFVLKEVIAAGYVWLAGLAVFFSLIGGYYYLRVVKLMYFDQPEGRPAITASPDLKLVLSVNSLAVLALGLAPGILMSVCLSAMSYQP
ncbi:MAG: NADH-quinone oxidoreductase subunit NuoN [Gammaproteobacteria bacterium]|nr:NADH-quinone oxidoreductase subunit NuoN [Gammaproteobacteria bacterium]MBI5617024.1 NADH-quinone oxidoreductase subunit NuoN [Gammaproteobacteria bacterium]